MESDWVEASLAGDLDRASRIQYREAIALRTEMPTVKEELEDFLPLKRVPAPPCPGFERLEAIMSIDADEPEKTLVEYKPTWSGAWSTVMIEINEEEV